jgi:hypothetical protein
VQHLNNTEIEEAATEIDIDLTGPPILYFYNNLAIIALGLLPSKAFSKYQRIGMSMRDVCKGVVPKQDENEEDRRLLGGWQLSM